MNFKQGVMFEDASITRRFLGWILDGIIMSVPVIILSGVFPIFGCILVWSLYGPLFDSSELRGTLGKYLVGIQIVNKQGQTLSIKEALLRNILKIVSWGFFCFGFVIALFTRRRQTFHDLVAETYVVYGRNDHVEIWSAWYNSFQSALGLPGKGVFNTDGLVTKEHPDSVQTPTSEESDLTTTFGPPLESHSRGTSQWLDELERLSRLHQSSVLTDEEFRIAKDRILKGRPS